MKSFKFLIVSSLCAAFSAATASAQMTAQMPPASETGQCFARVLTADIVETVTERVEIKPATTKQRLIPAVYDRQFTRVMIKEATSSYRIIPAVYETVTEEILVEPAREVVVQVPARYETYTETIEIEPAKLVWKKGNGLYGRGTALTGATQANGAELATGEVLCRVLEPAKTQTVRKTRMVEPPRTETRIQPARYRTVAKQVVKSPPRYEEIAIPADYASIPVDIIVQPARTEIEAVPAVFADVTRQVVRQKGAMEWAEVLCETNTTRFKIAEIQSALRDQGYVLAVDGLYGPQTQAAMERYQRTNGLAVGYMTVETVRALNIDPYSCALGTSDPSCFDQLPRNIAVAALQKALSAAGHYASVDGIHGPQTQGALEAFQSAQGLAKGTVTAETLAALNVTSFV